LGAAVALLFGYELDSQTTYIISLGFAFLGAAIFGIIRAREEKIPQEAIIGIVLRGSAPRGRRSEYLTAPRTATRPLNQC